MCPLFPFFLSSLSLYLFHSFHTRSFLLLAGYRRWSTTTICVHLQCVHRLRLHLVWVFRFGVGQGLPHGTASARSCAHALMPWSWHLCPFSPPLSAPVEGECGGSPARRSLWANLLPEDVGILRSPYHCIAPHPTLMCNSRPCLEVLNPLHVAGSHYQDYPGRLGFLCAIHQDDHFPKNGTRDCIFEHWHGYARVMCMFVHCALRFSIYISASLVGRSFLDLDVCRSQTPPLLSVVVPTALPSTPSLPFKPVGRVVLHSSPSVVCCVVLPPRPRYSFCCCCCCVVVVVVVVVLFLLLLPLLLLCLTCLLARVTITPFESLSMCSRHISLPPPLVIFTGSTIPVCLHRQRVPLRQQQLHLDHFRGYFHGREPNASGSCRSFRGGHQRHHHDRAGRDRRLWDG